MSEVTPEQWVAALKSGKYTKARGALVDKDGHHCCLGVLCHLIDPEEEIEAWSGDSYIPATMLPDWWEDHIGYDSHGNEESQEGYVNANDKESRRDQYPIEYIKKRLGLK